MFFTNWKKQTLLKMRRSSEDCCKNRSSVRPGRSPMSLEPHTLHRVLTRPDASHSVMAYYFRIKMSQLSFQRRALSSLAESDLSP